MPGFNRVWLILVGALILFTIIGVFLFVNFRNRTSTTENPDTNQTSGLASRSQSATWEWSGTAWKANGSAPACASPLMINSPVDATKATSILYPGQSRGDDYKPHGGFRFDTGTVTVSAPLDATVTRASRYIQDNEIQYFFEFVNSCGIAYRFDHLRTLAPAFAKIADTLPAAKVDDSRTTDLSGITVKAGDSVATEVGFMKTSNFSVDFGVYDFRTANTASQTNGWASTHTNPELENHAVCWLDLLPEPAKTRVQSLPAGDSAMSKTSDYCKE